MHGYLTSKQLHVHDLEQNVPKQALTQMQVQVSQNRASFCSSPSKQEHAILQTKQIGMHVR
jgi:hypothetical protein